VQGSVDVDQLNECLIDDGLDETSHIEPLVSLVERACPLMMLATYGALKSAPGALEFLSRFADSALFDELSRVFTENG
jgi:hypothetical protein